MADNEAEGTTEAGIEAPAEGANAPATGTPAKPDEVTLLRSRTAGLDAKVTALTQSEKAAIAERDAALAKLADYEAGKVGADEALRAQIAAKEDELKAARQEALLARIEAQYPETYAVLGEAAANLSADKLAEAEARFKGVAAPEAPAAPAKPIGNNQSRDQGSSGAETSDDIFRHLQTLPNPFAQ